MLTEPSLANLAAEPATAMRSVGKSILPLRGTFALPAGNAGESHTLNPALHDVW